jgi:plasmid maintenance system antidote protein VapI
MVDAERYQRMFQEAEQHADYWIDGPISEFTEDLSRLMAEKEVTRAELARRMGTSRAYITKMLGGNANFTLLTMVKLAMALDGAVHIHISDKRAVTRWKDLSPEEAVKEARKTAKARRRSRKSQEEQV